MTRPAAIFGLGAALLLAGIGRVISSLPGQASPSPAPVAAHHRETEPAPLCPWREPERDLRQFFPEATGTREERRILSHLRVALIHDLGRPLTSEEMLLRSFRVLHGTQTLGTVLLRRVKGEYGAIELVLAVAPDGKVRGVRLQRQREPEATAAAIMAPQWLAAFNGKTAGSPLRLGEDLPPVRAEARPSAAAIADGVRSLLILQRAAEQHGLLKGTSV